MAMAHGLLVRKTKMETDKLSFIDFMNEIAEVFEESMNKVKAEQEEYWNSLTEEQRLMVFCAVTRRIFDGEIQQRGSYRYILYNVFGFGPEAYGLAQEAGYLAIHNAIVDSNHDSDLLHKFCEKYNIDDADSKVSGFLR